MPRSKADINKDLDKARHSLAHILAAAMKRKFPKAKLGIGPTIDSGFYYDFEIKNLTEDKFAEIEAIMKELISQNLKFKKEEITSQKAKKLFADEPYKLDLIEGLKKDKKAITVYHCVNKAGEIVFTDLCAGPHIVSTDKINPEAFKLQKIAGAYWKGDEKNKMLTRIYALAFETKEQLDNHLNFLAEAERRDHRKLGKELDLFIFSDLIGPGLPVYTWKGAAVRNEIMNFSRELNRAIGFEEVHTPNMNKADLFKVSGHYEKYKEDMSHVCSNYTKEEYFLKPMNCPQHTQVYASKLRSYRDLPIRIADFANLYRDERPGELSGLTRLRAFAQDDGHSFCREDQIKEEFSNVLNVIKKALDTYGLKNTKIRLSLWDPKKKEKYLGDPKVWKKSQAILEEILIEKKIDYFRGIGEAAIYGPKLDIMTYDTLGREWQVSTIQVDFIMPQRFDLKYTDADGKEKTPVMIHRAIIGSAERFMGLLIEHYAGVFPTWLSPVQVAVLPVGENHLSYAKEISEALKLNNVRVEIMENETLGKRIREAEMKKTPYILVVGEKEKTDGTVSVRKRGEGDKGAVSQTDFINAIKEEIKNRSL